MDWKSIDERLIRRGEILLSFDFLNVQELELMIMNMGKVGRPFKITDGYMNFLATVRYLFSMPYRQLEGFTRALNKLIGKLKPIDYSWIRRRMINLDLSPYQALKDSREPVVIAIDASGVSIHKCGGWVERIHGKKKRYIKIHFAIDVNTKEVLSMHVTTDDVHESKSLPNLIHEASKHRLIAKAYMDSAYDSSKAYRLLKSMKIKAFIKPRRNARTDRGPPERRREVKLIKEYGDKQWREKVGYGKRWIVETAFSTFKRLYGEYCMAKNIETIEKELMAKAYIYNMLINLSFHNEMELSYAMNSIKASFP